MIGHNNGPPLGDIAEVAGLMRRYAWCKAHKAAWRTPPIEIVRLRERAAAQLGLSYQQYASILMDRGHRPRAIFFGLSGALVRARDGALMPGVETKLRSLRECVLFVVGDGDMRRVTDVCRLTTNVVGADAVRRVLREHRIATSQAIMVGATLEDQACAERAKLARFFWAWEYFTVPTLAVAIEETSEEVSHPAFRPNRQRPGARQSRHAPRFA